MGNAISFRLNPKCESDRKILAWLEAKSSQPGYQNQTELIKQALLVAIEQESNRSLEELCTEYIDNDKPLLIWATMSMKESSAGNKWYLEDGTTFTWTAGEHCLVLVGYNNDYYFLNDPMSGSTVAYQKNIVERRFSELGKQAIHITKEEQN